MTDFASIGIELDSRPVVEGTRALDSLAETSVRVEQKVGALNGQMNDTAAIMRKNAEAANLASDASKRFLEPLQREIDLFGASRAEAERYNAAKAGLSAATQRQAAALGAAIDAMQRDEAAARQVASAQDQATKAAERFMKSLSDQVATLGMNTSQLQAYRAAQLGVSDAAAPLIAKLGEAGASVHTAGKHMEGLNFQTVGARRELLVLAHELSQGNYQKFGGSMMVLGEQTGAAGLLFSATGLAALALVGTLGGLAYATIKGALEQKHMNDALIMTGNYAGLTSDSLNALAHSAVEAGGSIGEAKKVATELAGSGKFTGEQISYITEATVAWEHATGQSVKSIIKDFESLAVQTTGNTMRATEAISRATIKLDDQYHFLTEAVYEQIRALEKEGDAKGASALATETFAKVTHDRAEEVLGNLGTIARGWNAIKEAIGGAVDAVGNLGKKATPGIEVDKYSTQLTAFDSAAAFRNTQQGRDPLALTARQEAERLSIINDLTKAVITKNNADAAAIAQGKATLAQSEAVHAASRIAADDVKLQKKGLGELQVALNQYADDVAKVKAANPNSALVTDDAVEAHITAIKKAHTANIKGNDDRAKTLQDALILEQTWLEREKSIYDARDKMLALYHSKFGVADDEFYAGRDAARAEYIAAEAIAFAKESALVKASKDQARNPEEVAAAKAKYDELLKTHLKFVDDMRNAGGEDSAAAAAAIKKQFDDITKATHDAGVAGIKSLDDQILKQREHNAEIGKTKSQVELAKQAAVELQTVQMQSDADFIRDGLTKWELDDKSHALYVIRLNDLDEEINRRKTIAGLLADGAVLEANAKAAAEASRDWKRAANTIENDLTNAILDGGGRGWKKLVRDMEFAFARMVLQPVIQPLSAGIASMAYPGAPQAVLSGGGSAAGSMLGSAAGSGLGITGAIGSIGTGAMQTAGAILSGEVGFGATLSAGLSAVGTGTASGLMAGMSSLVGALGPIALGIGAVVMLAKALDHSGTPHTGGAASASSAGVSTIAAESLHFEKTQTSADAEKFVSGLASGIVGILDSTALAFGKTAGYTAATAFADDSSKDGAWGGLVISKLGQTLVDWQDSRGSGPWAPKVFADGAEGQKQYLAAISADVRTALNGIGLPDWAQKMLDGLGKDAGIDEMAKVVDAINATQKALKVMGDTLVGFSSLSEGAVSALMAAAGGIQNLAAGASAYYQGFYTEAEKSASATKAMTDALASVGLAMPYTNEGFRALVESQMALGEAGAPALAVLLGQAGAYAKLHPLIEKTTTAIEDQAAKLQAMKDAASGLLSNVDNAFSVLQRVTKTTTDSLTARITAEKALSDAIKSTLGSMKVQGHEMADWASGLAQIEAATAIAKAGGPLPDSTALQSALSAVSQIKPEMFGSQIDYERAMAQTQNDLSALGDLADSALSVDQRQLDSLNSMLAAQQQQIDILKGIDVSGLTIAQALAGLHTAIGSAQANPIVGSTAGINGLYQSLLGRAPDAAGMEYWQQQTAGGLSMAQISAFIKGGAEFKHMSGVPGFASGGDFGGGLRLVGERGPEIEATGASRIWNASQTASMMSRWSSPSDNSAALAAELKELRKENAETAKMLDAALTAIAKYTLRSAEYHDKADGIGTPPVRDI